MSDYPKVQDAFERNIRCLNDQIKYEEWRAEILNYIMSRYPVSYSHIEHQVNPVDTFEIPTLDYTICISRKSKTLADGFRFDNIGDVNLPMVRTTDENFSVFRFDTQDVDFYYKYERNPQFAGISVQKLWEMQLATSIAYNQSIIREIKPQIWSELVFYCSETILAKARISKDVYDAMNLRLNYI